MARLTLAQSAQIDAAALSIVGAFGIVKLDTLVDYERSRALRKLAGQLRDETGTSYATSRQKIAWACQRLRAAAQGE